MNQFVRSDFYAPLMMWPRLTGDPKARPLEDRDFRSITIKGRLKSGCEPGARANGTVSHRERSGASLSGHEPRSSVWSFVRSCRRESPSRRPTATLIAMLTTLAFAVLFVACANVAGLLTSRAPARAKEMAMRLAIGAGRGRLIRQLMTESLLIALAGGVLGLAVGYGAIKLFQQSESRPICR